MVRAPHGMETWRLGFFTGGYLQQILFMTLGTFRVRWTLRLPPFN
ncbi:hypothetical protein ACFFK0_18775 [Paenibacillus chartarius]|uniref:Uncharacterized protein n=1 Tax=Paenibacillus chartarius TaxID=747481 RepID=A0ABV6DPB0_9BACL